MVLWPWHGVSHWNAGSCLVLTTHLQGRNHLPHFMGKPHQAAKRLKWFTQGTKPK